jgi:hypothetical protein
MKTKISFLLSAFLVSGFYAGSSLAQVQGQKPQLYMLFDCAVKPGMVTKYEAALKEERALIAEGKSLYPWRAYSSDDFHYYSIVPIKNYADIDAWDKADEEMRKRVGEERFTTNEKAYDGTFEYNRIGFVYLRADLSYAPEKPRLKPEEANFFYWGLCYVDSAKWDEFIEILKEYVAMYKSKNVASGFTTYQGG